MLYGSAPARRRRPAANRQVRIGEGGIPMMFSIWFVLSLFNLFWWLKR